MAFDYLQRMKSLFLLLFCFTISMLQAQKKKVGLVFTYRQQYCGGARPSEEIQNESERDVPYANQHIIFVSQKKGRIDSARTDSEGHLKIRLRKGVYHLYELWRFNLYTPENLPIDVFEKECLKSEWMKPFAKFTLEKKKKYKLTVIHPIIKYCAWNVPCLLEQGIPPGRSQ